jgi:hypothetical protein
MLEDRFFKRLRKKARKGLRGWPIATIAFYGPNLTQATKVAVGICHPRIRNRRRYTTGKWTAATSVPTSTLPGRYWNLSRSTECSLLR